MSNKTYTLTSSDTVAYIAANAQAVRNDPTIEEVGPFEVKLFQRPAPDAKPDGVLTLNTTFAEGWQAAKQRQAIMAAGKINLDNWNDGPEFEAAPF